MVVKNLVYTDNLLRPAESKTFNFKGKDPMKIFSMIKDMFVQIMEIDTTKVFEDLILWDANSGSFQGKWRAKKPFDRWTNFWIAINVFGTMERERAKEKIGRFTMRLRPYIETKVEYAHDLQKAIWWSYNYIFYNNQRRSYMHKSDDLYRQIESRLRATLGAELLPTPAGKAAEITAEAGA